MAGNLQESLGNSGLLDERIDQNPAEELPINTENASTISLEETQKESLSIEPDTTINNKDTSAENNASENDLLEKTTQGSETTHNPEEDSFEVSEEFKALDDVKEMSFNKTDSSETTTATEQLVEKATSTTSDFLLNNLINGAPEVGGHFTRIDQDIIEQANLPKDVRNFFIQEVENVNTSNKEKFQIPDWHINNIREPLKDTFTKHGWEQSIPPELQLAIGVLFFLIWGVTTYQKIQKSNEYYLARLEKGIERLSKKSNPEPEESQKEGKIND